MTFYHFGYLFDEGVASTLTAAKVPYTYLSYNTFIRDSNLQMIAVCERKKLNKYFVVL